MELMILQLKTVHQKMGDTEDTTEWEKMLKTHTPGQHRYNVNKILKVLVNEAYSESQICEV